MASIDRRSHRLQNSKGEHHGVQPIQSRRRPGALQAAGPSPPSGVAAYPARHRTGNHGWMTSGRPTIDTIARTLENVAESFAPNELAYLALTSKIEHPIRDRLAWAMHTELWPEYLSAREWRRTDLAVLDRQASPVVLLEAKAMYSFDGCTEAGFSQYLGYLRSDRAKASTLAEPETTVLLLLLATHPEGAIDARLNGVVKYRSGITAAAQRRPDPHAVRTTCMNRVTPIMESLGRGGLRW